MAKLAKHTNHNSGKVPSKQLYILLNQLSFDFKTNPYDVLKNIFQDSNYLSDSQKCKIKHLCHKDINLTNFIINKVYCLHFTEKSFRNSIQSQLKFLGLMYDDERFSFHKFKYIFPVKVIQLNLDFTCPLFSEIIIKPVIVDQSQVTRKIEFKQNNLQKVEAMVSVVNNKHAKWRKYLEKWNW